MINLLLLAVVAYVAGILTFLAPCTLPMIPVYLSICMKNNFRSLTLHTTFLAIGIGIMYVLFGVFAGSVGGFFAANQEIIAKIIGALLFLVGITTLFGWSLYHIFPEQNKFTPLATMGYGMLFGLAWSGCIGPVLGGILILASATGTAVKGGLLLLLYAAGMLTPLFIISFIADRNKQVPKLWSFLRGKAVTFNIHNREFTFHTTNVLTGALFIFLGAFFFFNGTKWLVMMYPSGIEWVYSVEEKLQAIVS